HEDVVLQRHSVPQLDPAFHRDAVAHYRATFDKSVVADVAIRADTRALENVGESPYPGPRANLARLDTALRVREIPTPGRSGRNQRGCRHAHALPPRNIPDTSGQNAQYRLPAASPAGTQPPARSLRRPRESQSRRLAEPAGSACGRAGRAPLRAHR